MRGSGAARTVIRLRDRDGEVLTRIGEPAGYWEARLLRRYYLKTGGAGSTVGQY